MKKVLLLLLVLMLSVSLCACGGANSPGGGENPGENPGEGPGENPGEGPEENPGEGPCVTHTDADNNGKCDACAASVIVIIDFYTINDLHGKLSDTGVQPGVDELTTYLASAKETDDYAIVLANGDMWQGTSESNLTRGKMMTEWLNEIETVAMTLGNHEFDWANDYIRENLALADFPFIAINIYNTATDERMDFAEPSVTVSCGDAKIGIIGAIGDCHSSISQDKVMGIEFKVGEELSALVRAESEKLRSEGCDFIVFAVHDGVSGYGSTGYVDDAAMENFYDVALSDGCVDLVFESHTHQEYVLQDSHGVYHIQGGGDNTAISHVEVQLNYVNDDSRITDIATVRSHVYDDHASDPIVDELKEKYESEIAKGSEVLGTVSRELSGDELRQLCADLYLEKGLETWGEDYDVVLSGGYISIRSPYMLYAGEICYEDVYSLFPFDNGLYLCSVTGSDLKANFLYTENPNYFICMSDYGASASISDSLTYYIITDAYSAFYEPNHLTIVEALSEEVFARDLIAQYIKDGGFDADAPEEGGGGAGEGSGGEEIFEELKVTAIADVLQDVNAAGVNVEVGPYYVLGRIVDDPQQTYGNCTIRDLHGNEIYIYGLRGANDERYDALADPPKKGDTVLVFGNALLYQRDAESELLPELKNVRIRRCFETVPISEALSIGNALQDNASTAEEYAVLGRIVSEPQEVYGNCTVAEGENETLYIYGLYDESGDVRYDSFAEKPGLSDLVIVKGHIKKYVKASGEILIEFENGRMLFFCSEE